MAASGVSTGCTSANEGNAAADFTDRAGLGAVQREILFDPQTSGGLLLALSQPSVPPLLDALAASGHRAAEIGEVVAGPARIEVM